MIEKTTNKQTDFTKNIKKTILKSINYRKELYIKAKEVYADNPRISILELSNKIGCSPSIGSWIFYKLRQN